MAKLYIVPTPIGNLDDITLRAVNVLRDVDFILAEDTRTTSFLLKHLGIEKSGFPCDRFCFEGFLPQKKGRAKQLQSLAAEERTMIFYESPYRVVKCLEQFAEVFGPERRVSVSRELTKKFEQTVRGTVAEVLEHFRTTDPKGEFVIVLAGKPKPKRETAADEEE